MNGNPSPIGHRLLGDCNDAAIHQFLRECAGSIRGTICGFGGDLLRGGKRTVADLHPVIVDSLVSSPGLDRLGGKSYMRL